MEEKVKEFKITLFYVSFSRGLRSLLQDLLWSGLRLRQVNLDSSGSTQGEHFSLSLRGGILLLFSASPAESAVGYPILEVHLLL
jgi:hypothetical protein